MSDEKISMADDSESEDSSSSDSDDVQWIKTVFVPRKKPTLMFTKLKPGERKKKHKQTRINGFNSVTTAWIPPVTGTYKKSGRVPQKTIQQNITQFTKIK
jgi:hypothetical protein